MPELVQVARATTIVTFAPDSQFPHHTHGAGEEYLVLDGVFSDDITGDGGPGAYVRNPIGTSHAPWSSVGGTFLVKLRQMTDTMETRSTMIDTRGWRRANPGFGDDGIRRQRLYDNPRTGEWVAMEWWRPGFVRSLNPATEGGLELFVVEGDVRHEDESQTYGPWSWFRLPAVGVAARRTSFRNVGEQECVVWVKTGHLRI